MHETEEDVLQQKRRTNHTRSYPSSSGYSSIIIIPFSTKTVFDWYLVIQPVGKRTG